MARFANFFFALVALFGFATALKFSRDDGDKVVLNSFGEASDSISLITRTPGDVSVSSDFFSAGTPTSEVTQWGTTNYTIPLFFNKGVGSGEYTVTVGGESITGKIVVAGFVIVSDGKIVSGDDGEGVTIGQEGAFGFDVRAVGIDGAGVSFRSTSVSFRPMSGGSFKEIDESSSSITSSKFTIAVNKFRVGSGNLLAMFDSADICYRGECFETTVKIRQATTPAPPCVAIGGEYETKEGMVAIPMYNLLAPPQVANIEKVVIHIGSTSVEWDKEASSLSYPDQVAVFKTPAGGDAVITCDGNEAYIMGTIKVSGDPTAAEALATELIAELPESDSDSTISASISVVNSSSSELTKAEGQAILDKFCQTIGSSVCSIVSIGRSPAVIGLEGQIPEDKSGDAEKALVDSFEVPTCAFQTSLGYECEDLLLNNSAVKAAAGAPGLVTSGLATWTIAVIAGVGALALILVIVLGLWAVYRRSAEQSESDYSSSGPLGVPDPSDLLYEQSIVRDIYGRGDFPEGGPSQAVAEQRAREADLREEMPRPPSSSGLSRGSGTDDASSTYSV